MDEGLVPVSRSRFGRIFLAVLVLGGAAGGVAGAVSELHGPERMAALAGAGALAGWGLAVLVWGAGATAIRPSTRALETWSRWGSPRWRLRRTRPLPAVDRVVFTPRLLRSSRATHVVFPFHLEGPGGTVELDTALELDDGWSAALTVASALDLGIEDRRASPPRVMAASSLKPPPAPASVPDPPPGGRARVTRDGGVLRVELPPQGAGPGTRRALRLFLGVLLFFLAMAGLMLSGSRSSGQALERTLAAAPLVLLGGMPFFLVVLSAWVWRESVEAGSRGLTVRQRHPFPAATTRWSPGGLLELSLQERGPMVPWIGTALDGPCLRAIGGAGAVRFAAGCSRAELEWLRGALWHALEAGRREGAPGLSPAAPGRGGALAFLVVGALAVAAGFHEPWLGTVIERHRDEVQQRLTRWQSLAREAAERPGPAAEGFSVDGAGIAFRWDWEETCNAAAVHVEDLLSAADPPDISRVVDRHEWLHDWAGAIAAVPPAGRRPEDNPRALEGGWQRWRRLRYLLLVCRRVQAEQVGYRGTAWLVDLEGTRWLGGVTFGTEVSGSRIEIEVAAEVDLEQRLARHLPKAERP